MFGKLLPKPRASLDRLPECIAEPVVDPLDDAAQDAPSVPVSADVHMMDGYALGLSSSALDLADGEIITTIFDEVVFDARIVEEAREVWDTFIDKTGTREAAGEAIYTAIFEGAPTLRGLFKTPRAIQAQRFMDGLSSFIRTMGQPSELKANVETLAFSHLNLDITIPRIVIFRDAILDLLQVEVGERFGECARVGWKGLLNYAGGAMIFVKENYAARLKLLAESWQQCNRGHVDHEQQQSCYVENQSLPFVQKEKEEDNTDSSTMVQNIPTTFVDMFRFNAAVMGFGHSQWMNEVLECFDTIVTNAANANRMQQECDLLVLRIANVDACDAINLNDFTSCMLAALRSLLPTAWSTQHEVAWAWLWENTKRMLQKNLSNPPRWRQSVEKLSSLFNETEMYHLRKQIFARFFVAVPEGQNYFKQSDTRLHFIIERAFTMVVEIFKHPIRMCDDISALGLRHVGYGIPTQMFGPFVTAAIETLAGLTDDQALLEAFRWSLGLIANLLVRTITEGSTIVMKAVNANCPSQLRSAVAYAARGQRATVLLKVQVGANSISPLYWALENGALDVAQAIIEDLLTIRADRKKYYYGVDELFNHHRDVVKRLLVDAPSLLPLLLDRLVWRSRNTKDGMRRVNYYIKNLVQDASGEFAPCLPWLVEFNDPKIISHPCIVLASDTLWSNLVGLEFGYSKIGLVVSLFVFVLGQAVLPKSAYADSKAMRIVTIACRIFCYLFTLGRLLRDNVQEFVSCWRTRSFVWFCRVPVPAYLSGVHGLNCFVLMLLFLAMASVEPAFWCIAGGPDFPQFDCGGFDWGTFRYSMFASVAMTIHWVMLVDLAVFNTSLSAFLRVVSQVMSEMGRFCIAFVFLLLMFGTAASLLRHQYAEMKNTGDAVLCFFAIALQVYEDDYRSFEEPALLVVTLLFVLASGILLLNLLVAQLGCSYEFIYQDSIGFARLRRAEAICQTIEVIHHRKWVGFLKSLEFEKPIEFNEGDVGISGGMQILEAASLHPVTTDCIYRFGGTCSPDMQWPEELRDGAADPLDRIEQLIQSMLVQRHHRSDGKRGSVQSNTGMESIVASSKEWASENWYSETLSADEASVSLSNGSDRHESDDGEPGLLPINTHSFEELVLDEAIADQARILWYNFIEMVGSREAAGEAIHEALLEHAPFLAPLFKTPKAVLAVRFVSVLDGLINALADPKRLSAMVETLAFAHMNYDITVPYVETFRDAIVDLFALELENRITREGLLGWLALLNYTGGALIYIKSSYSQRLSIITDGWKMCTQSGNSDDREEVVDGEQEECLDSSSMIQHVPTDFKGMFQLSAAIMGLEESCTWMSEVLACFDNIVVNFCNSDRLQQECNLLCIRLNKIMTGPIPLGEYKSCMLATLRSLLSKGWSTPQEEAWAWLWENVERLLQETLGKPPQWEAAVSRFILGLSEEVQYEIRREIYERFFEAAPSGQDYFKQSDTRLHFIANRAIKMTIELYNDPWRMADEISALGLRHVGYGSPTELFGPFVTACITVLDAQTHDDVAIEGFRWALALISKMLVRTITEGATIVMKAINNNCKASVGKALASAPRASRAAWCLIVQVGTQDISPVMWSIQSGSFNAAVAIIEDLLTIRADREKYYYGAEELFTRHPDIIRVIVQEAPTLFEPLLDGLVWRSRTTKHGLRRVNFYVQHLVHTISGQVSPTLAWVAGSQDPKMISHPVIVLVSDKLWSGIVSRQFIVSKRWFLFSLTVKMMSQAVLPKMNIDGQDHIWLIIFIGRMNIYAFTMCRLLVLHIQRTYRAFESGKTVGIMPRVRIPEYLCCWYDGSSFALAALLMLMLVHEPMLWCVNDENWPTEMCAASEPVLYRYTVFCSAATAIHWGLLVDFAVFNTGLSAFVLVVAQVMNEIIRFVIAVLFLLLTFACAVVVLEHNYADMQDVPMSLLTLLAILLRVYEHDFRNLRPYPALLAAVFIFVTLSAIILLNLLTAQLNCSYEYIYQASVGFARLNRAEVIVETLRNTPTSKWAKFVKSMRFDMPLEFNEGDRGMSGGLQVMEPAFLNPVTADRIMRFGGSCAPEMPWPEEGDGEEEDDAQKIERLEQLAKSVVKEIRSSRKRRSMHRNRTSKHPGLGLARASILRARRASMASSVMSSTESL